MDDSGGDYEKQNKWGEIEIPDGIMHTYVEYRETKQTDKTKTKQSLEIWLQKCS